MNTRRGINWTLSLFWDSIPTLSPQFQLFPLNSKALPALKTNTGVRVRTDLFEIFSHLDHKFFLFSLPSLPWRLTSLFQLSLFYSQLQPAHSWPNAHLWPWTSWVVLLIASITVMSLETVVLNNNKFLSTGGQTWQQPDDTCWPAVKDQIRMLLSNTSPTHILVSMTQAVVILSQAIRSMSWQMQSTSLACGLSREFPDKRLFNSLCLVC